MEKLLYLRSSEERKAVLFETKKSIAGKKRLPSVLRAKDFAYISFIFSI